METIRRALYLPEGGLNIDPNWKPKKVGRCWECVDLGVTMVPTKNHKKQNQATYVPQLSRDEWVFGWGTHCGQSALGYFFNVGWLDAYVGAVD